MKHVIVPFDFSDEARNGISLAVELAKGSACAIHLVYVQRKKPDFGHVGLLDEKRIAEREFQRLVDETLCLVPPSTTVDYLLRQGKVYREIVALANEYEDSVIVTSTHGASGVEEFFIGSNTLRILAATSCPVFTIRHGVVPEPIQEIIFPLDTSFESRQKAPHAARLATEWRIPVRILAVAESVNESVLARLASYERQMEQYFAEREVECSVQRIEGENIVNEALAHAMLIRGSLIVITSRERDTHPLLMIGDKSQRLISESPVPVLVIAPQVEPIRDSFKTQGS